MAQRRLLIKSHPRREAPRTTFADPTRTGGLRRQFVAELRRQFSQLKADLLRYQQSEMVANVFCPTGEGGGVDPTCSPGGSAVHFGDLSKDVQTRISVAPWDSLNPELRDPTLIRGQEFHQDRVRKTDELFKHAVELRRPEKFIRGVSGTVYPMKAGETFTEPGYLRLSNDQSTAEGFTERPGKTGQVLHLTVPKGSRVLPGDHVREHEIYLPRGASFRVTRVESKENDLNIQGVMQHIHHIHAELVTSKGVNNSLALDSFSAWLEERARQVLLSFSQERLWSLLVDSAFRRGASRSFDDVVPRSVSRDKMEFDRGSREGFLTALMAEGMSLEHGFVTNVERIQMPQVRKADWDEFLAFARERTTLEREDDVDPTTLSAVQHEFSQERVDAIPMEKLAYPILVSLDGFVMDGNHRWIKAHQTKTKIPVLRIGLKRNDALDMIRSFPKSEYVTNSLFSRLRSAFDTVKTLAKRAWDEFRGGVAGMVSGVQRAATDGVLEGKNPQQVVREAIKIVDKGFQQAKGLVQTEVTRAHAKGQLVGFVALGVKEVGVLVEWRVKRDANGQIASTVCPSCRAMEGVVLKISEADGLIPLHPRCMCAYSKPRENVKGQKRSKGDIDKAIAKARARRKAKPGQGWGAKVRIAQKRPTGNRDLIAEFSERIENVFCPTGPGGGVDPSCSPSAKIQKELDRVSSSFSSSPLTDAEDRMVYDWKTGNSNLLDKPEFIAAVEKGVVEKDVTVYRAGGLSSTKALEFTTRESWAKDTAEAQDRSVITIHLKKGDRALFVPLATRHHIVEVGVLLPPSTMRKYENVTNVFCPTGPGGGVDPTCSPSKSTKVVTIIKDMVRIQAERFKEAVESGKYGDNGREMLAEDPDMKKFTRNWNKTLKGLEADPVEAAKIQASVDNAYEQYDIPKVQVFVRKQTLEEKQTGENAHWDNGFVVISDDVMGELKYRSSVSPLGSDRKTTVKQSYPDLVSGLLVHELGHKYHDDNPHIMGNARTMVGTSQKEITTRISSYAATNPKELVAEAYAMSKHPDYSSLPKETRELINKVLHGVIK